MKLLVDNLNLNLRLAQTVFIGLGFWAPESFKGFKKNLITIYMCTTYMFLTGAYVIIQTVDLYQVWGDVTLMTGTIFLLFTNMSLSAKAFNIHFRKKAIKAMIDEANCELSAECRPEGKAIVSSCNRETEIQLYIYLALTYVTIVGWAISADKNQLPLRAWYPYDTTETPAYQLTYAHQCIALVIPAFFNICMDTLVTTLISQCRCRFNLLALSLRRLCDGLQVTGQGLLTPADEAILCQRLRHCVKQHQAILAQAAQLQDLFSTSVLGQFSVSMVIICVTAYQMALALKDLVWFTSMLTYLGVMLLEVFIYCYHGNRLLVESGNVSGAVYEYPWYECRPAQRRRLLLVMRRAQREARLRAGGLTDLSLITFMAILKASYSFFTVLQTVEDGPKH